jgi:elongation factor G
MSPMTDEEAAENEGELMFEDKIRGGRIPSNFIPAIEKGFRNMFAKGPVAGFPVVCIKIELNDGSFHEVDSSEMAFMVCAQNCFRETFPKMKPVLLEPIMLMELEMPESFQGSVVGNISSRRGIVMSTDMVNNVTKIIAEVPLAETFGYSTDLRSMTQGQGTFTMEFAKYRRVPASIQEEIVAEKKKRQLVGAK